MFVRSPAQSEERAKLIAGEDARMANEVQTKISEPATDLPHELSADLSRFRAQEIRVRAMKVV